MGLLSSNSKGGTGGCWEKRMKGQGRERGMERESGGIISLPSCSKEMVDEGQVFLAFAGEGVCVEGFYAVGKIDKAEGRVTLDLSEASS
jgi:hypothetical protein